MKKKIKGWAVICGGSLVQGKKVHEKYIYAFKAKSMAEANRLCSGCKVLPCEITYSLPTKKK